jgi:hypothetical protein
VKTIRLTNAVRNDVLGKAMADIFKDRTDALVKQSCDFAQRLYTDKYGDELQAIRELNLEYNWLSSHNPSVRVCRIRDDGRQTEVRAYNPGGHYIRSENIVNYVQQRLYREEFKFADGKSLPFPGHHNGLPIEHDADGCEMDAILKSSTELMAEEIKLRSELSGFLTACKNSTQLEANWPEGVKYLPKQEEPKKLPIPLIDNVRSAMK